MIGRVPFAKLVCVLALVALSACRSATEPDDDPIVPDEPILAGGAGDQSASDVATDGSAIYVSGPGIIARFDSGTGGVDWSVSEPGVFPEGIAARPGAAFIAGRANAARSTSPGPCGASDDVGGIEQKSVSGLYDSGGNQIQCSSVVLYPYSGFEFYWAATYSDGKFFAGGHAQQAGVADGFPMLLARYGSAGLFEEAVAEPDLEFGGSGGCCTGESVVYGLGPIGSDVLAAGDSRLTGNGEDDVRRPMVMRYTSALDRVWKSRSSDLVGRFFDVAEAVGAVYAVGQVDEGGVGVYVIEKYDTAGNRQWSVTSSAGGVLRGVAAVGSRVFAVGGAEGGLGGSDAVVVEIDPTNGDVLSTTALGGPEGDTAIGVVVIGGDLWVAGTTRSFATGGNQLGEADLAVWRVPIG